MAGIDYSIVCFARNRRTRSVLYWKCL